MATILDFEGISPRIHAEAWIAPTAAIIGNVVIERGATVWFGAVIRGDNLEHEIRIGAGTSIQDNCVIHVSDEGPTLLREDVTVGHGAVLESCIVGRGALIGMNAVVLPRAEVGYGALVAAGSVVVSGAQIPARHLAAGAPAVVKKELSEPALQAILKGAQHYVALGRTYREADER